MEERLTLKELSAAAGPRPADINLWIKHGGFKPSHSLEKGRKRTFSLEDAIVLRAIVTLLTNLDVNLGVASTHAEKIRGAKRGFDNQLVVAREPVATMLNIATPPLYHAPSDTHGAVIHSSEVLERLICIVRLGELEGEVWARLMAFGRSR